MRTFLNILLVILICTGGYYIENYQPELVNQTLIQVDVFGLTRIAEQEKERLQHIKDLAIPYEEKQVLINRTVFMGATQDMVKLALGSPKKVVERLWPEKNVTLVYYVYYLPNDNRPTILIFQDDKLINAYKGSAIDVGN